MKLAQEYFLQSAINLAPDLIGKLLCRKIDNEIIKVRITETECYAGFFDSACHASKGKTPRNEIMFSNGGVIYVYLCYGIHKLLNIITGIEGHPEGVLIRGVEGAMGPGRVTKLLNVTLQQNKQTLCEANGLWIEDDGVKLPYKASKRIGIGYAMPVDQERLWRFTATKIN